MSRILRCVPLGLIALASVVAAPLRAQDSLRVVRVNPAGDLRPSARLEVAFNTPLAAQLEALRPAGTFVRLDPAIPATITWRDPATLRITPDSALPPGSAITVVLDTFTLPDGRRLASRWSRTWLVQPPRITAMLPTLHPTTTATLGFDARIALRVRGIPDSSAIRSQTAFVSTATDRCALPGTDGRVGVRVVTRRPRAADSYPLQQYFTGRDSLDARFDRIVELTPEQVLPDGCVYDLQLGGVLLADGASPSAKYRVRTLDSASLRLVCDEGTDCVSNRAILLRSPAAISWSELRRALRWERADAITWPDSAGPRTEWRFPSRFAARDTVRVSLATELRDVHGRPIPTPALFVLPDRFAAWNAQQGRVVLPRDSASTLPVRHVGIDSVRVTLLRGSSSERRALESVWAGGVDSSVVWRDSVQYVLPLSPDRNLEVLSHIPLRMPDASWQRGLLGVRMDPLGIPRRFLVRPSPLRFLVQHSDLAVHARVHANGGGAFVTDLRGRPLVGVQVHALDLEGRRVASAQSDINGLVRLDVAARHASAPDGTWPFPELVALELQRGTDRVLTGLRDLQVLRYRRGASSLFGGPTGPAFQHASVITDRKLYRPGETIHATAIVRDGWSDALRAVSGERVRLRLLSSSAFGDDAEPIVSRERVLSPMGLATDSLTIPAQGALGGYLIELARRRGDAWFPLATEYVSVTEYRAQELSVGVAFDPAPVRQGDTLRATVRARLLLDAPLSDAEVRWFIMLNELSPWGRPAANLPRGWTAVDEAAQERTRRMTEEFADTVRTDADGNARIVWPTSEVERTSDANVTLVASVRDRSGQVVTAEATTTVRGSELRVAMHQPRTWTLSVGQRDTHRIGVVDRAGRWVDGVPLSLVLVHRRWEASSDTSTTEMVQRLDTLERVELVSRDSSATFTFAPTRQGDHAIIVSARDVDGRSIRSSLVRYATPAQPRADSLAFPFSLSRDSARVGDELTVQFESPWTDAEAWVVVARDRLITQSRVRARAGGNTVRFPIDRRWFPRASVTVTLVRRDAPLVPVPIHHRYRVSGADVEVDDATKQLQIRVAGESREVRPGTTTTIALDVRDTDGRPVAGEAVVWAVDEGVLALTSYEPPDPARLLFRNHRWTTPGFATALTAAPTEIAAVGEPERYGRMFHANSVGLSQVVVTGVGEGVMLRSSGFAAGGNALMVPGINSDSISLRQDFRSTAFYRSRVRVGTDGLARVQVRVPDGITTYRVMAVVVDARDRSGSGVSSLIASKPLVARAALPRFLRTTDRFAAGVAIDSRGVPMPRPLLATLRTDGAVSLAGPSSQSVSLDSSGARINFDATVGKGTSARFTFTVESDTLHDGIAVELPTRPDQVPQAFATVASVRDSARLRLPLPPGTDAMQSHVTLRIGTSPVPVLRDWHEWLDGERSPFTYRAYFAARGLVAMLRLHAKGALTPVDTVGLRRRLDVAVATLQSRVDGDGAVAIWEGSDLDSPDFSAAVGTVLLDARAVGAAVSADVVERIHDGAAAELRTRALTPDTTYGNARERQEQLARHLTRRLALIEFVDRWEREDTAGDPAQDEDASDADAGEADAGDADPFPSENLRALSTVASRMRYQDRARVALLLPRGATADSLVDALWRPITLRGERVDLADSVLTLGGGYSRIAPFGALLQATLRHRPDHPMIGALALRIMQQARAGVSPWSEADYADAIDAIAAFTKRVGGSGPSVTVRDAAGDTWLSSTPNAPRSERRIPLDSLLRNATDDPEVDLTVRAPRSEVYVTLTANVLRSERPVAARDEGLRVERWYERVRDGRTVTEIEDGELVRVRLRITTAADREFFILEDPIPAGLEVADPRHRGTGTEEALALEARRDAEENEEEEGGWSGWRWFYWDHVERRDDRVVVYARGLPAGTHEYTYLTRATTAGRFVRPQATAREFFNPALEGASEGGWFTVTARPPR